MHEFYHILKEANAVSMVSIDRRWGEDEDDGVKELDVIHDARSEDPIRPSRRATSRNSSPAASTGRNASSSSCTTSKR